MARPRDGAEAFLVFIAVLGCCVITVLVAMLTIKLCLAIWRL